MILKRDSALKISPRNAPRLGPQSRRVDDSYGRANEVCCDSLGPGKLPSAASPGARLPPADGAHGAGEPDLGRGAHRSRTFGEAPNPGFAPNGAGVLAAREGSARR
jgi:hypothetical protein